MSTIEIPALRAPHQYVELPRIPSDWKVADVGPGSYPHPRADVYIDHDPDKLTPLSVEGKETVLCSIEDGLPAIADKAFDFVWCSHVLEHVEDPAKCAATLSRIAKSGTVVLPSAIKESMFNFEEADHKWLVLPHPFNGQPPIFVRHNPDYISRVKNYDVQRAMCFLFRTGSDCGSTVERGLREWFANNELYLDIIVHWSGELKLQVIG